MLHFLPIMVAAVGGYFLVRLRAFFFLHPFRTLSLARKEYKNEGKGALSRLALALAGTLGVGNVTGVAAGILIGGAGSVLWILVSALFSAPLKYAESVAAVRQKNQCAGSVGFPSLIKSSFPCIGAPLASLYALLTVGLAFFMGSALQGAAAVETVGALCTEKEARACTVLFVASLLFCVLGNSKRLCKATAVLIPIAMIMYTIICIITVFSNISNIGRGMYWVVKDAFSMRAFCGGVAGAALASPLKEGFARGLLSNEAGAGTSAYAHAKGHGVSPFFEGVLGIFEILFDTVILCMLTAFSILLSVREPQSFSDGTALLSAAFSDALGRWYAWPLIASVFLFALSSAVCWYEYGRCALGVLKCRGGRAYFLSYLAFCAIGAYLGTMVLLPLCDTLLFFLALLALPTLIKNSAAVCAETDRALGRGKTKRTAAHGGEYRK